jgi:hypothetical protein
MTALAIAPATSNGTSNGATASAAAANFTWLGYQNREYADRVDGWTRDFRRYIGGDEMLPELQVFDWETKDQGHHKQRQSEAVYINLPRAHVSTVTGHLRRHAPTPGKGLSFGALGDVRERDAMDTPTRAELLWYNLDGVGNDGSSWPVWWDSVDELAQVFGHMWVMVESPDTAPVSFQDELNGSRPYGTMFTPIEVPNWYFRAGQLQFAVVKVIVQEPRLVDGAYVDPANYPPGYFVLIRKGWDGFGEQFAEGGWWLFDNAMAPVLDEAGGQKMGRWDNTDGEIPMFLHYGRTGRGSIDHPRISASDTMELGQLATEMMNTRSARKFDFWDACASKLFVLGATPDVMKVVTATYQRSQLVSVPMAVDEETGDKSAVTIYDGSTGTVAAEVADKLEASQWETSRRLMLSKVTTPGESGKSKDAGFVEASAPELVRRAMLREQSENNFLFFACKRWGQRPDAYSLWPREFDLQPLVDDIDALLATLRLTSADSATLDVELVMTSIKERGVITDEATLKKIRSELETSRAQKAAQKAADLTALNQANAARRAGGAGGAPAGPPGAAAGTGAAAGAPANANAAPGAQPGDFTVTQSAKQLVLDDAGARAG